VRSYLLPLLALLACNNIGKSNDSVDTMKPVVGCDEDGDGYEAVASGGDDCDDSNAAINPGASETAGDTVDSNCDGADDT